LASAVTVEDLFTRMEEWIPPTGGKWTEKKEEKKVRI
jgi:hypothetical protein